MFVIAAGTLRHGFNGLIACFVVVFTGTLALLICGGLVESGATQAGVGGGTRTSAAHGSAHVLVPIGAVFGGLCVLLTAIIVGSTLSLVVRQRARDLALLRANGASSSFIRQTLVVELACTGIAAILLAWVPSILLGGVLLGVLSGSGAIPEGTTFRLGPVPVVCAAGATLGCVLVAVLVNSSELARIRPAGALGVSVKARSMSVLRLLGAIGCLGGAVTLSVVTAKVMHGPTASATAGPAALLWAGAMALLCPVVGQLVGWIATPVASMFAPGYLAVRTSVRRPIESAGIISPVMLVVGLAGSFMVMDHNASLVVAGTSDSTASWINVLLIILIVGYAVVSLVNSAAASIGGRRAEFSLLRLSGLTRSGLLAMIGVESVVMSVTGVVLGFIVVISVVVPYNIGLADEPFIGGAGAFEMFGWIAVGTIVVTMTTMNMLARFAARKLVPDAAVG